MEETRQFGEFEFDGWMDFHVDLARRKPNGMPLIVRGMPALGLRMRFRSDYLSCVESFGNDGWFLVTPTGGQVDGYFPTHEDAEAFADRNFPLGLFDEVTADV